MFGWLRRRGGTNAYYPGEMQIYSYFDGKQVVRADPMTLYKRVMEVGPELAIDIKVANSVSRDANKAHEGLLKKIRTIFNVRPLEEGGLTEVATANLLDHFLIYTETVKKNSSLLSTSSILGDSAPSLANGPVTTNTSESGLTANVSSTEGLPQPPSAPA